jgi:hypothetical protein
MSEIFNEPRPFQEESRSVDKSAEEKQNHESDTLDEALKETFPASDPVAIGVTRIDAASAMIE